MNDLAFLPWPATPIKRAAQVAPAFSRLRTGLHTDARAGDGREGDTQGQAAGRHTTSSRHIKSRCKTIAHALSFIQPDNTTLPVFEHEARAGGESRTDSYSNGT